MRSLDFRRPVGRPGCKSSGPGFCIKPTQLKALLVEDNPHDQFMITRALRRCSSFDSITITAVSTVETARAALASEDFDVIISDFLLHGECSAELFRTPDIGEGQIATILVTAGTPTPAVRAYASHADATICLGRDDLTPARLDQTLVKLTKRHNRSGVAHGMQGDPTHRVNRVARSASRREAYAH